MRLMIVMLALPAWVWITASSFVAARRTRQNPFFIFGPWIFAGAFVVITEGDFSTSSVAFLNLMWLLVASRWFNLIDEPLFGQPRDILLFKPPTRFLKPDSPSPDRGVFVPHAHVPDDSATPAIVIFGFCVLLLLIMYAFD